MTAGGAPPLGMRPSEPRPGKASLEDLPEEELHRIQMGYEALAQDARRRKLGRRRGAKGRSHDRHRPTPKAP